MVSICSWRSLLTLSIIAAKVVDLPEPVAPVTNTNPEGRLVKSEAIVGKPRSLIVRIS